MAYSRKALHSVIIFATLLCSQFSALGQSIDETLEKVENLVQNGDQNLAIILLKRCLYFAENEQHGAILTHLGDCNLALDSLENAYFYYQKALVQALNDSLHTEIIFKIAGIYLKQHKPNQVLSLVENQLIYINSVVFTRRKYYFLALAHYQLHNYKQSQIDFLNCSAHTNMMFHDSLTLLFQKLATEKFYNPQKAKNLSRILPGLGQWYVKDYKNSLNSFCLNASLLGLGIWGTIAYTPFDGILWVLPWLRRYYIGGYQKAEFIAVDKNNATENVYLKQILELEFK